ncbi:hypothetical protein Bca4012_025454 [Brassica carinata]
MDELVASWTSLCLLETPPRCGQDVRLGCWSLYVLVGLLVLEQCSDGPLVCV